MIRKKNNLSLPVRIIIYMVTILLFTAGAILLITANHFNAQTKQYHEDILKRKVRAVESAIDYEMDNYPGIASKDNIHDIFQNPRFLIALIMYITENEFHTCNFMPF